MPGDRIRYRIGIGPKTYIKNNEEKRWNWNRDKNIFKKICNKGEQNPNAETGNRVCM